MNSNLDWTSFKAVVDSHILSIQYVDTNSQFYHLSAPYNNLTISCQVFKDGGSDVTDFETNYKMTKCNLLIPAKTSALSEPNGFRFRGRRTHIGSLTNETKLFDYVFVEDLHMTGAMVKCLGTDWQDYIKFSIHIPVGHVMNPTETEIEADAFSQQWAVSDDLQMIEVYKAKIYTGFIARAAYTTVSASEVNFWINLFLHKKG